MHTVGHPVRPNKPIPPDDLLCFRNIFGEGQPAEIKTVTGWGIDNRRFLVFLTKDKQSAWSASIQTIINRGSSTYNEIETLVGGLNHCGYIIPLARHFLHPIRGIMRRSAKKQIKIWPRGQQPRQPGPCPCPWRGVPHGPLNYRY